MDKPMPTKIAWGRADSWVFVDDIAEQLHAAADLLRLMHDIAEDSYCESWSSGTGPEIWRAVLNVDAQPEERGGWGYHETPRIEVLALVEKARHAGCWWTWDEAANDVVMVPLSE